MNDFPKNFFDWVLGILGAVLAWLGVNLFRRLEYLEKHYVTRTEMEEKHKENTEKLKEIKDDTRATRDRVDSLYTELMQLIGRDP